MTNLKGKINEKNGLFLSDTLQILDNSKMKDLKRCPRYFFFSHILGWKSTFPSIDLAFGSAYHAGHEYFGNHGYSMENLEGAMNAFMEEWRLTFDATADEIGESKGKTPAKAREAYIAYLKHYKDDFLVPLYNEVGVPIPLGDDRIMYVKLDRIARSKADNKIYVLDFKTSGRESSYWAEQWESSNQFFAYLHALYCMYPFHEVGGLYVDGVFLYKSSPSRFRRHLIKKTPRQMEDWLYGVQSWYDYFQSELEKLMNESKESLIMKSFPRNDEGCVKYNRLCPFHSYCLEATNPLRHWRTPEDVPNHFKVEFWDPRTDPVSYVWENGVVRKVDKVKKEAISKEEQKHKGEGGLLSSILGF